MWPALPILLRRFVEEAQVWPVQVGRPIRRPRHRLVEEVGVKQAVRLALVQPNCGAVLILLDGNSDCPADLGPTVQSWATEAADGVPCSVILAHREYEAWFLAAIESLRGHRGVRIDADPHPIPENPRGAKEQLESRMQPGVELCGNPGPTGVQRSVFDVGCLQRIAIFPQARRFVREAGPGHGA